MAFRAATYWDLVATFARSGSGETFEAVLVSVDGRRIPAGRDFDPATGRLKDPACLLLERAAGRRIGRQAPQARPPAWPSWKTSPTPRGPIRLSPPARCSRKPTASTASPRGGRWTWPKASTRTGTSPTCAPTRRTWPAVAIESARQIIASQYGKEYLPDGPRIYQTKVKNAQEAHEAIRPAGHPFALPESLAECAQPRRVPALRLDLEADRGQPDDGCAGPPDHDQRGGRRGPLRGQRQDHRFSRLLAGLCGRLRRSRERIGRPRGRAPAGRGGRGPRLPAVAVEEPHHAAAQSLQRSLAHAGPGGNGHRPAQHLRLDHRYDPRPRLRVQVEARQRAGADLDGLRRFAVARSASAGPGQLPVHRRDGRRARRHQPRRARFVWSTSATSISARTRRG